MKNLKNKKNNKFIKENLNNDVCFTKNIIERNFLITIKVIGSQWYWSYEYNDYSTEHGDPIEFDSYMIPETDLQNGEWRLLDVDNKMVVPTNTHIRLIATGSDVIHSFAVPSLGLKLDCIPGRLNRASVITERTGLFYGQCSEICGVYHGFMPIVVESVTPEQYLGWVDSLS